MKKIGFTGTRKGMTVRQKQQLIDILQDWNRKYNLEFRHGAAVGADSEAHELTRSIPRISIKAFPATKGQELARNKVIIQGCDLLIAAPAQVQEILRSGTWATVRYARKAGIPVVVMEP